MTNGDDARFQGLAIANRLETEGQIAPLRGDIDKLSERVRKLRKGKSVAPKRLPNRRILKKGVRPTYSIDLQPQRSAFFK